MRIWLYLQVLTMGWGPGDWWKDWWSLLSSSWAGFDFLWVGSLQPSGQSCQLPLKRMAAMQCYCSLEFESSLSRLSMQTHTIFLALLAGAASSGDDVSGTFQPAGSDRNSARLNSTPKAGNKSKRDVPSTCFPPSPHTVCVISYHLSLLWVYAPMRTHT